jgi:hypothetical protein
MYQRRRQWRNGGIINGEIAIAQSIMQLSVSAQ